MMRSVARLAAVIITGAVLTGCSGTPLPSQTLTPTFGPTSVAVSKAPLEVVEVGTPVAFETWRGAGTLTVTEATWTDKLGNLGPKVDGNQFVMIKVKIDLTEGDVSLSPFSTTLVGADGSVGEPWTQLGDFTPAYALEKLSAPATFEGWFGYELARQDVVLTIGSAASSELAKVAIPA